MVLSFSRWSGYDSREVADNEIGEQPEGYVIKWMGEVITYAEGWQTLVVVRAPQPFAEALSKLPDYDRKRIAEAASASALRVGTWGSEAWESAFPLALTPAMSASGGRQGPAE
ncbi:hypothetical protein [Mesorhizobium prunaredense]|nr:hypothetical protein [Mesorhizobium prunaredense]